MNSYFFILGRNPLLSYLEVSSYLKTHLIESELTPLSKEILIVKTEAILDLKSIVENLGGTVKSGKIVKVVDFNEALDSWEKLFNIEFLRKNFVRDQTGKLHFGVSLYDGGSDDKIMHALSYEQRALQKSIRTVLKGAKISAGFVQSDKRVLPTATILYNKLLYKGFEMVLVPTQDKLFIGLTETIQDFNAFSFRDMERPVRDKKSGIIPPKLGRIMIHLASTKTDEKLLDPFCGSGTILMEAMMIGIRNISGSDLSAKAVSDSKQNILWLKEIEKERIKNIAVDVFQSDIKNIIQHIKPGSTDVIATEPFLGENTHIRLLPNQIYARFETLKPLYLSMFEKFSKVLKPGGRVAVILPAFFEGDKLFLCPYFQKSQDFGLFPIETSLASDLFKDELTTRGTYLYGTKDDFTVREICIFRKKDQAVI